MFGAEAPTDLLAALTDRRGLASALADGVLESDGVHTRFRHGALQRAVYDDLASGRRLELHHAVGTALRATGAPPTAVADQLLVAGDLDPVAALDAARAAARAATADGAHGDAARWYERSVPLARALGPEGRRRLVEVLIGWGDALRRAGDRDHERILFEAADLAIELDDPALVGATAMAQLELGATTETGQVHTRAVALADHALAVVTDPEQRARIAASASLAHSMSGHAERCRDLFLDAEGTAREPATRRAVLPFTYLALGHPDDLDRREVLTRELLRLSEDADDPLACFEALQLDFSVALQRSDGRRARTAAAGMEALVEVVGDVGRAWAARYVAAAVAHLDDDLDRSEALTTDALELFSPIAPARAFAVYGAQLLVLRLAQGRIGELAPTMEGLVADQPGVPAWHAALALAVADTDPAVASRHARLALDDVPADFTWLAGHVIGARAVARAGDAATSAEYARRLTPYVDLVCWQGTCSYGPVATALAALARAAGDRGAADTHAATASRLATRLGAPVFTREVDELMAGPVRGRRLTLTGPPAPLLGSVPGRTPAGTPAVGCALPSPPVVDGGAEADGGCPVVVGVLGPCTASLDGETTHLAATPRRVLARLALAAPDPVTHEAPALAVWDLDVPTSAGPRWRTTWPACARPSLLDGERGVPWRPGTPPPPRSTPWWPTGWPPRSGPRCSCATSTR